MSFAGRVGARITAPVCSRPEPGQLAALVSADSIASVGVWRGRSHRVQSTPEGAMSYAMGVDVSKSTLEVCAEPSATTRTFANDQVGIAELIAWLLPMKPSRVVFEASGGYEKELLFALKIGRASWKGRVGTFV